MTLKKKKKKYYIIVTNKVKVLKKKNKYQYYLDAVPNAVIQACIIPLKNTAGFCRVKNQNIVGRVINAWNNKPNMTVTMYRPNIWAVAVKLLIDIILPAIRHIIPNGEYLHGEIRRLRNTNPKTLKINYHNLERSPHDDNTDKFHDYFVQNHEEVDD